jgi:hypothetical protein
MGMMKCQNANAISFSRGRKEKMQKKNTRRRHAEKGARRGVHAHLRTAMPTSKLPNRTSRVMGFVVLWLWRRAVRGVPLARAAWAVKPSEGFDEFISSCRKVVIHEGDNMNRKEAK